MLSNILIFSENKYKDNKKRIHIDILLFRYSNTHSCATDDFIIKYLPFFLVFHKNI